MCINKEVSLMTFLFSWGIGFYLLKRNYQLDRWYGLLLLTFSSMQFVDYLLWVLHDKNMLDSNYNLIITTYVIPLILLLQVFAVYIGRILFESKNKINNKLVLDIKKNIFPKIIIIYSFILIIYSYFNKSKTTIGKEGHLDWGGEKKYNKIIQIIKYLLFVILLIYPFLKYYNKFTSIKILIIYGILSLVSVFIYTGSIGSYWCWIANLLGILFLFSPYLDK